MRAFSSSKITVMQWITRREFVDRALSPFQIDLSDLAFVVSEKDALAEQPAPIINLRSRNLARNSWWRKSTLILSYSAVLLVLLAGSIKYWQQQTAIEGLDARISTTKTKAQQVRALVDQLQEKKNVLSRLRVQRSNAPGLIDVWEEATRVLPSNSWLIELRLAEAPGKPEQQLSIFGFSTAAPSLVGVVDSSPLFFDAALNSPISFDQSEGRERFALQARVRMPVAFKEMSR